MRTENRFYGAVETGGTKTDCAIGNAQGDVIATSRIATTTPQQTFERIVDFFLDRGTALAGIGVGTFGPVDIDRDSTRYGRIGKTPKAAWSDVDVAGELSRRTGLPIAVDTDVNCALRGEAAWGAAKGLGEVVYVTVGTGIGGGILLGGEVISKRHHPEIGHMLIPCEERDRQFPGACPFHGNRCAEGLASGPAIALRWGIDARDIEESHEAWDLEATYLAILCVNLFVSYSPNRIVLGGGVMQRTELFPRIRRRFRAMLNGYLDLRRWHESLDDLIVPVALDGKAGILGACRLAHEHFCKSPQILPRKSP